MLDTTAPTDIRLDGVSFYEGELLTKLLVISSVLYLLVYIWWKTYSRLRRRITPPRVVRKSPTTKAVRFQLRIGRGLEALCGQPRRPGSHIEEQLNAMVERFLHHRGLPPVSFGGVALDPNLELYDYRFDFATIPVGGTLEPGCYLATIPLERESPDWLLERRVMHPVLDVEAAWIDTEELPDAWAQSLPTESCLEVLFHHFRLGMAAHIDQVFQESSWAIWQSTIPETAQAFLATQGRTAGEGMRSAIRQGASMLDGAAFFSTLAHGLRSGKTPNQVGKLLAERYPSEEAELESEDVRRAAACFLFGQLSQHDWLKIEQVPGGAAGVADILLRARSLPRWQKLQALQQIHCLKHIFGDRHGIAELFKDTPLQASEPQKLAALLLALPQEQAQSLVGHLQRTLPAKPFDEMAEWMARWSHLVEVGFPEGWSEEAENLLLR